MIPLSAGIPRLKTPVVTILLILANLSVFVLRFIFPAGEIESLYFRLGCIPYEIIHLRDIGLSALVPLPFTAVTALFLHGGWIHLAGNMLFLWVFGKAVETRLGRLRYTAFYLGCGVLAVLTQAAVLPDSRIPVVGASGAVAAVMAAFLVFHPEARIRTIVFWFVFVQVVRIPAVVFLGVWIAVQALAGLARTGRAGDGVAWFAHLGGFCAGLGISLGVRFRRKGKTRS